MGPKSSYHSSTLDPILGRKFFDRDHPLGIDQSRVAARAAHMRLMAVCNVIFRFYVVVRGPILLSCMAGHGFGGFIERRDLNVPVFHDLSPGEQGHLRVLGRGKSGAVENPGGLGKLFPAHSPARLSLPLFHGPSTGDDLQTSLLFLVAAP